MDFPERINAIYSKMDDACKNGAAPDVVKKLSDEMYSIVFEYHNYISEKRRQIAESISGQKNPEIINILRNVEKSYEAIERILARDLEHLRKSILEELV